MKHLLIALLLLSSLASLQAQTPYTIDQNTNKCCGADNNGIGTSFLTIGAGYLDSIEVVIRTGNMTSGDFYVYDGNTNDVASQIHHEVIAGMPTGSEISFMIHLTSNVLLNAASTYTFMLYNSPLRFGSSDSYAGGSMWTGNGFLTAGEHTGYDLDFIAYIGAAPVITSTTAAAAENSWVTYIASDHKIELKNFQAEEIFLHDLQGKLITSGAGDELNLNNFNEGVYVISARKGKEVYTAKIYLKP